MEINNIIRPLSATETFYVISKVSIQIACHIRAHLLSADLLQQAILQVMQRHVFLSCRIIKKDNLYFFEKNTLQHIPLKIYENIDDQEKSHLIACQELNIPLPEDKVLWRVSLLLHGQAKNIKQETNYILLTTIHHAIADGVCCIQLQQEILKIYADLLQKKNINFSSHLPVMPALEDLIPKTINETDLQDYIKKYIESAATINAYALKPLAIEKEERLQINFVQRKLSVAQTETLLTKCKENNISVHGVICAAHLLAVKKLLNNNLDKLILCCHSPVDIRSRLLPPLSKEHMLSAAIGCTSCCLIDSETSLWSLGKKITLDIQRSIDSQDIFKGLLTFKETRAKFKLPVAFGVTNVGVVDMPVNYGVFELQEIYFIPAFTLPMLTAAVVTFNKKLVINYPYTWPYYSERLINELADLAMSHLLSKIDS